MGNSTRIRETIKKSLRIPDSCENCKNCDVILETPEYENDYKVYYCKIGKFSKSVNLICDFYNKKEVI